MPWLYLGTAIVAEVIATSVPQKLLTASTWSDPHSRSADRVRHGILLCISYSTNDAPFGIAYAVWSAVGIALEYLKICWLLYKQSLDIPAIIGIGLYRGGSGSYQWIFQVGGSLNSEVAHINGAIPKSHF